MNTSPTPFTHPRLVQALSDMDAIALQLLYAAALRDDFAEKLGATLAINTMEADS